MTLSELSPRNLQPSQPGSPPANYGLLSVVPPVQHREEAPLGNNSKFITPPTLSDVKPTMGSKRPGRYTLHNVAKKLLPDDQVAWCSTRSTGNGEGIKVNYDDHTKKSSYGNLQTCSSVWTCPVCSPRIMSERGEVLERVVEKHRAGGGGVILVTLSLRHQVGDSLDSLLQALNKAWTRTKNGAPWKRFKERVGQVGDVNALEITWGQSAGWHPHKHVLMLLDHVPSKDDIIEIRGFLSDRFITMAEKEGVYVSASWGVDVRGHDGAAAYISKLGDSAELTSTDTKTAAGVSPFGFLELYHRGDKHAGYLFQEYAAAVKGRKRLFWSQSLKDARKEAEEEIDAEKEEEEKPRTVVNLHGQQWDQICKVNKRDDLLLIVGRCAGDYRVVWKWLEMQGVRYDPDLERVLLETEAENRGMDMETLKRERNQARFMAQVQALEAKLQIYEYEALRDQDLYQVE